MKSIIFKNNYIQLSLSKDREKVNDEKYELKWPGGEVQILGIFLAPIIFCVGIYIIIREMDSGSAVGLIFGLFLCMNIIVSLLFWRGGYTKRVILDSSGVQLQYIFSTSPKIYWSEITEVKLIYFQGERLKISGQKQSIWFPINQGAHEHYGKVLDEILNRTNLTKSRVTATQVIYR